MEVRNSFTTREAARASARAAAPGQSYALFSRSRIHLRVMKK
jgi:hypothetical protein